MSKLDLEEGRVCGGNTEGGRGEEMNIEMETKREQEDKKGGGEEGNALQA